MKRLAHTKTGAVLATYLLYFAWMAASQWILRFIGNVRYGTPDILPWILLMELPMILLLTYTTRRFFTPKEVGLQPVDAKRRWLDWGLVIAPIALAVLILASWLTRLPPQGLAQINKAVLVTGIVGIVMVGISEEWMFRGLILHHFSTLPEWNAAVRRAWNTMMARGLVSHDWSGAANKAAGIAVSAVLFSLFHLANLAGGYPPSAVAYQLIGTLAFGIVFGVLACWLPSIRPLMAWHFLWDYFVIVGSYVNTFQ